MLHLVHIDAMVVIFWKDHNSVYLATQDVVTKGPVVKRMGSPFTSLIEGAHALEAAMLGATFYFFLESLVAWSSAALLF